MENSKFHDIEIIGLYYFKKRLEITLEKGSICLEGTEYWELTPFECQNVIFELNYFKMKAIPDYILNDYEWIRNYKEIQDFKLLEIVPSCGLGGVILFKEIFFERSVEKKEK